MKNTYVHVAKVYNNRHESDHISGPTVGQKIKARRRQNHESTAKLLIKGKKSPSSPLFFFFYTISHSFMFESLSWAQG
jgi:hypothetical protein